MISPRSVSPTPGRYADPPRKSRRQRILAALGEALVPSAPQPSRLHERLVANCEEFLRHLPHVLRLAFPVGLWLLEWSPVLLWRGPCRLSKLPREVRRQRLREWAHSRWAVRRQLLKGVRSIVVVAYYDIPEIKHAIQYTPQSFISERVQARAERYQDRGWPLVEHPHAPAAHGLTAGAQPNGVGQRALAPPRQQSVPVPGDHASQRAGNRQAERTSAREANVDSARLP